ncbi:hypothetical protein [Rhabdothermincola sp.]|uniref:hypothetical protein n=1 Tax=Rhabdothermincola sp. TaxID=2820405 RepID=UPI002FDF1879
MTEALTDVDAPGASEEQPEGGPSLGDIPAPPAGPDLQDLEPSEPPPPPSRLFGLTVEGWVSLLIVAGCVLFTFSQLSPSDVLSTTTPAGGDMGAHVWAPAYLRDHLLPAGRLTGWTPDWYDGFPAFHFYMVIPSLVIALLSYVLPYGLAFKLVAVSGVLTLPVAGWAFGRLTRLPFPVPALLAVGMTAFLFDRSFSIYGGNIPSTLAGEFAFSISLTFALLYLGVLGRGLETGRHRGWAATLLALTALCHLIPLFFALAGTVIWFVLALGWRRLDPRLAGTLVAVSAIAAAGLAVFTSFAREIVVGWVRFGVLWAMVAVVALVVAAMIAEFPKARLLYLATVLPVAGLVTAFWTFPFYLQSRYMNDMGWEKKENYANYLFSREHLDPQLVDAPPIKWLLALAAVGALMAIVWGIAERRRGGMFWIGVALVAALGFVLAPQGRLWNARLLPFYYLALYCLGAIGVAYVLRTFALLFAKNPVRPVRWIPVAGASVAALLAIVALAVPLRALPRSILGMNLVHQRSDQQYQWWFFPPTKDDSFIDSWARWNFSGYEGKAAYPEYHDIVQTMADLGRERGCGRAMWEHEEQHDRYGTPMALMLLPFWTDGCIGSQEGLYFEASSTTPYHFINQDELSSAPSNAQRDLPYGPGVPSRSDFDRGIQHLQMLGVKYYMAISDRMIDYARRNPDLTEVATSGPWVVFEVADSELVTPLRYEPAVVRGIEDSHKTWLERSMRWYTDPRAWAVPLAADGPPEWQRIDGDQQPSERPVSAVTVSNIRMTTDSIEFDVNRPGTPVLVKASYFPNWKASGAQGPYRVTPNLMVVVPTSDHVELRYGYTGIDLAGWGLSFVGLVGLFLLFRARPLVMPDGEQRDTAVPDAEAASAAAGDGDGEASVRAEEGLEP